MVRLEGLVSWLCGFVGYLCTMYIEHDCGGRERELGRRLHERRSGERKKEIEGGRIRKREERESLSEGRRIRKREREREWVIKRGREY